MPPSRGIHHSVPRTGKGALAAETVQGSRVFLKLGIPHQPVYRDRGEGQNRRPLVCHKSGELLFASGDHLGNTCEGFVALASAACSNLPPVSQRCGGIRTELSLSTGGMFQAPVQQTTRAIQVSGAVMQSL